MLGSFFITFDMPLQCVHGEGNAIGRICVRMLVGVRRLTRKVVDGSK